MFMMLSSRHSYCESLLDECWTEASGRCLLDGANWLGPWAHLWADVVYTHRHHTLSFTPKPDTQKVESLSWPKHWSKCEQPMSKLYCMINTRPPQWDLVPWPHTLQSSMLLLDHTDLLCYTCTAYIRSWLCCYWTRCSCHQMCYSKCWWKQPLSTNSH